MSEFLFEIIPALNAAVRIIPWRGKLGTREGKREGGGASNQKQLLTVTEIPFFNLGDFRTKHTGITFAGGFQMAGTGVNDTRTKE